MKVEIKVDFDAAAFAEIIKFKRKGMQMSRKKLSALVNVSVHHIANIENGHINSIELLFMEYAMLCAYLDISLDRYFTKTILNNGVAFKVKAKRDGGDQ